MIHEPKRMKQISHQLGEAKGIPNKEAITSKGGTVKNIFQSSIAEYVSYSWNTFKSDSNFSTLLKQKKILPYLYTKKSIC